MPNRLAQTTSLYLQKHAANPIDWSPWEEATLSRARQENKPIFLSIGYSSCHWCTVMEGEAFSNQEVADYMNAHFVPIKVDREERPDLDSLYMQALQMMTGQGGWPLNIFLAPDTLVPFYAGTYFPLEPRYGRPGFLQVLQAIHRFYNTEPEQLLSVTEQVLEGLQQFAQLPAAPLAPATLLQGLTKIATVLAPGPASNRFPMIPYAIAALRQVRWQQVDAAVASGFNLEAACMQRGLDLVLGGIYDHVAGGFHRYTVDPTWTVPHFEKMLYDNGQILEYLADLWATGEHEPAFERAVAGTVSWLQREMTAPQGYFYAAQDADSFVMPGRVEPEEGAFYVWRYQDLAGHLTIRQLQSLENTFTVTETGNFEGQNVLQRRHPGPLDEGADEALAQLFQVRYGSLPTPDTSFPPARNNREALSQPWPGRIPPVTDTKMIVAWNSLMISGLARAAAVWQQAVYLDLSIAAADFILQHQWVAGRMHRLNYGGQVAVLAQSEDFSLLIKALLDLHQATLTFPHSMDAMPWLERAIAIQAEFDQWLWSEETGGYYTTAQDASADLVVRERNYQDSAIPSANGIAISNLMRLALLTDDSVYLSRAEQALQSFGAVITGSPLACPSLLTALDWYQHGTLVRTTPEGLAPILQQYRPVVVGQVAYDLSPDVVGLVCQGLSCQSPAHTKEQLDEQIEMSQQHLAA